MGHIYLIRNLVNGKGYVGQTVTLVPRRFDRHRYSANRGSGDALHRAMRKYGVENFSVTEVLSCDPLLLNDLERHYIRFYGTHAVLGHGYNLTEGGDGSPGSVPTTEQREKMSIAHKGKTILKDQRDKISAALKGRVVSKETGAKISAAKKGKRRSAEHTERLAASIRGRKLGPRSMEVKAKISAAKMGKKMPEHVKAILLKSNLGKHRSDETRMKMSVAQKRRVNVN